jgi:hypothetical protein
MTSQERDQIVPLLAVFDALFGYLLVSLILNQILITIFNG